MPGFGTDRRPTIAAVAIVSVIIPCRNAEQWVSEAIQSCLDQDIDVEVVAVDDGSTDSTGDVLRSFGSRVTVLTGRQRGAPAARNAGFAASGAPFVQFLDADDVILPGKLGLEVDRLGTTGADVVYGDWRYQFGGGDVPALGPVQASGAHDDPIEALLDDWWIPTVVPLHRRSSVVASGGWDPAVRVGQDHDLLLSSLIAGARLLYEPGCRSHWRRHDDDTVSRGDPVGWFTGRLLLLQKAQAALVSAGTLDAQRRRALARSYHRLARWWYSHDRATARRVRALAVETDRAVIREQDALYRALLRVGGFDGAERVAGLRQRLMGPAIDPHPAPGR